MKVSSAAAAAAIVSLVASSWTTTFTMIEALDVADGLRGGKSKRHRRFKMGFLPQRLPFVSTNVNGTVGERGNDYNDSESHLQISPASHVQATTHANGDVDQKMEIMHVNGHHDGNEHHPQHATPTAANLVEGQTLAPSRGGIGKSSSYLSRLITKLQHSLEALGAQNVTSAKLEHMSVLIHECMSNGSRNYHSIQHIFDLCESMERDDDDYDNAIDETYDPIGILAALFHDVIYISVDDGFNSNLNDLLEGCLDISAFKSRSCTAHNCCDKEPLVCMVETLFGYGDHEEINSSNGINEFLSAMVAVRMLEPHLPTVTLAQISICIAATIPFKNKDDGINPTYMESLYSNCQLARERFKDTLLKGHADDDEFWIQTVQMATRLGNTDVGNFGSEDRHYFLDNTWSLLSETNTPLRNEYLYTIMDYHEAVFKLNGFFNFMKDPERVFASFHGVPSEDRLESLTTQCSHNLALGKRYVRAKLLSASVLAAFAKLTGGDVPVALFMGDLPSRQQGDPLRLDDFLPNPCSVEVAGEDGLQELQQDEVFQLLSVGRRSDTAFDVKSSPLAAYLYASVSDEILNRLLSNDEVKRTMSYPMTDEQATELLQSLPLETVKVIGDCVGELAVSRKTAIQDLLSKLTEDEHEP